jgi:hypothetical protein
MCKRVQAQAQLLMLWLLLMQLMVALTQQSVTMHS